MELEILRKKISTFRGEGGRVRITDDSLLMEILSAWEQWTGPASGFYGAIGVSQKGISSIIGKAKKLRREGHFPAEEFKEIKVEGAGVGSSATLSPGPCVGIELGLTDGRFIRFPSVDPLLEFLKKAA
jgi:hypothetical protein